MSDLGYTFTTQPYKERINGVVRLKFNIEGIEQNYDFTRQGMVDDITTYNNTIDNMNGYKMEKEYFIEIYDNIPDPDPELNTIIEEEM